MILKTATWKEVIMQNNSEVMNYDCLVIGGGIFGITAAVELANRGFKVGLINPDTIPHHLAASTDITKAVRMEYGSDQETMRMVETCIKRWREWNDFFEEELYHEVGFLMLSHESLESERQRYEWNSYQNLLAAGYDLQRLGAEEIRRRFPAVNTAHYVEAVFNPTAGYVQSGRVVEVLADYGRDIGVDIFEGQTAADFVIEKGHIRGVRTREGETFFCDQALVAAGAHTPYLLPELQPFIKATGHPVFWLKPADPAHFQPPQFAVFAADISNTGWYGFPYFPQHGVVKVAKHAAGLVLHPDKDDRQVHDAEVAGMRQFLAYTFPELVDAPLVYTRRCLYTDTLDGQFWIDRHPEIEGLAVSSGGSGHAMKMAPLLGELAADVVEGQDNPFLARYRWRELAAETVQIEEARHVVDRKIG